MGGGSGSLGRIVFYVILAFLLAALLNLIAGFMPPRRPTTTWLLSASAGIWLFGGLLLGLVSYADPARAVGLIDSLKFTALLAAPGVLPLAAWAFARWKFRPI